MRTLSSRCRKYYNNCLAEISVRFKQADNFSHYNERLFVNRITVPFLLPVQLYCMKIIYPRHFYALLIPLLLFSTHAYSTDIRGIVLNAGNKSPIANVIVSLDELQTTTVTNAFGNYSFSNVPDGNYHIEFIFIGFEPAVESVILNDQPIALSTLLIPSAINLEAVSVAADHNSGTGSMSALDIRLRPVSTAQDFLRLVPGLFIAQHAGGGKAEQMFLRGFDIDHGTDVSVNVDGMPVNMVSHAHGQGYADLHFVIPETIRSFDFQKGPYNPQYGDFTTAAFVNFNTYDAIDSSMVKLTAGQFNTLRTMAMLDLFNSDQNGNKQSVYLAGEYYISDGPFIDPQDFIRTNIFAKYHAQFGNDKILNISASTFKSQWNASGQIPERAVEDGSIDRFGSIDNGEGGFTGRSNVNIVYTKLLSPSADFTNQIWYSKYNFELYSDFTFFLNDSINGDMIRQKEDRYLYGYTGIIHKDINLAGYPVAFKSGFGFRSDRINNDELSHVAERSIVLQTLALGDVDQLNTFAYVSLTTDLTPQFSMETAIRADHFKFGYNDELDSIYNYSTQTATIPTYKLNFDYHPLDNLIIYLHNGKGFHSNDARVVIAEEGHEILPAAYGSDLGVRIKPIGSLIINPALWILYLEQEFVYVGDEAVVEPSGKTLRKGFDLSARWQITKWLFADADVNYTIARALNAPEGEDYIPLAPDLTSIGGLSIKSGNGWSGSLRYRYMHDRPANEDNSVVAKGYFVNDLVANYAHDHYSAGIEIQNLFNVDWNEAQFETTSRLQDEPMPVTELHFTPGTPFFLKLNLTYSF